VRLWALILAVILLGMSLIAPSVLRPANILWTRFGLVLARVVNPIVLGFLFFIVVTPTGLLMRVLGKNLLNLNRNPNAEEYWVRRNPPGPGVDSMKNQF